MGVLFQEMGYRRGVGLARWLGGWVVGCGSLKPWEGGLGCFRCGVIEECLEFDFGLTPAAGLAAGLAAGFCWGLDELGTVFPLGIGERDLWTVLGRDWGTDFGEGFWGGVVWFGWFFGMGDCGAGVGGLWVEVLKCPSFPRAR